VFRIVIVERVLVSVWLVAPMPPEETERTDGAEEVGPPPPLLRTNRTRRVLHPVLIGHAAPPAARTGTSGVPPTTGWRRGAGGPGPFGITVMNRFDRFGRRFFDAFPGDAGHVRGG